VTHRLAAKSLEGSRQPGGRFEPQLPCLPPEVRELEVEPPAVASNVLCPLLPLLSATPGLRATADSAWTNAAQGEFSRGQGSARLADRFLLALGLGASGAGHHPHGSAGSRSDYQDVSGSAPGRRYGPGRGGQPSAAPRSRIVAHQLALGSVPGQGRQLIVSPSRSPGARLPGPVGHTCCPLGRERS
jgi:hypothetical protein